MGDGDAWVVCALGHRHWGRFGAAGLLIADADRAILQHRAPGTHEGDTWGVPGGARDSHESAVAAAVREAGEEAGIPAEAVAPLGLWVDDHGGWSYTTVAARPTARIDPHAANWESADIRWCPLAEIETLRLHPGFASSWPRFRRLPAALTVVVDAANVVGSVPNGWWRDRAGAAGRLLADLAELAEDGVDSRELPAGITAGGLSRMLPSVVVVLEGAARAAERPADHSARLVVRAASHEGDDAVVDAAREATAAGHQVSAVTADRELRTRLPSPVVTVGPAWLHSALARRAAPRRPSHEPGGGTRDGN